ncbi:MAG: RNA polymerase subunit sigma-70 [Ignavibacteria bacterium]|nr:MAG: RNA polymerase subunit sigma-70 [Ignavibacteria bacterium]
MAVEIAEKIAPPRTQDPSDDILVTRFQSGDDHAFRLLVERYSERIRNLVFSVFHDTDLIDDVTQDVFIKAYRALPNFRFDASLYTWLYRITINHCRDIMRKQKLRRTLSLNTLLENRDKELTMKTAVQPEESDTRDWINRGLQRLPEKYRTPVILKDMEGCSYQEMAEIMQCELGTVKSRLSRGRSMLRSWLEPILEG